MQCGIDKNGDYIHFAKKLNPLKKLKNLTMLTVYQCCRTSKYENFEGDNNEDGLGS